MVLALTPTVESCMKAALLVSITRSTDMDIINEGERKLNKKIFTMSDYNLSDLEEEFCTRNNKNKFSLLRKQEEIFEYLLDASGSSLHLQKITQYLRYVLEDKHIFAFFVFQQLKKEYYMLRINHEKQSILFAQ